MGNMPTRKGNHARRKGTSRAPRSPTVINGPIRVGICPLFVGTNYTGWVQGRWILKTAALMFARYRRGALLLSVGSCLGVWLCMTSFLFYLFFPLSLFRSFLSLSIGGRFFFFCLTFVRLARSFVRFLFLFFFCFLFFVCLCITFW